MWPPRRRPRWSSAVARPPPAFCEELVEEILFRIPPDDPASLARAALVCRPWLPAPPLEFAHCVAALLCAAPRCDHLDCSPGGAFAVVFLGTDESEMLTSACVYSSQAGTWSKTISVQHPVGCVLGATSAFTGNAVYFSCYRYGIARILEYHLGTAQLSVISLPPGCKARNGRPMTWDDGRLAFAAVQESKLYIWSREDDSYARWTQRRVMELNRLLPFCSRSIATDFVSSADGFGVIFMRRGNFLFTIDLKSCQVRKVYKGPDIYNVVPYMSFCTPALGAAVTGKEPTL